MKPNEPIVFRRDRSFLLFNLVPTAIFAVATIVFLVLSFTPLPHPTPYPLGAFFMGVMFGMYLHAVMLILGQRVEVFSDRVVEYAAYGQSREHRLGAEIEFFMTFEKDVAPLQYSDNITSWNLRCGATRVKLPPSRETIRLLAELRELFPTATWPKSSRLSPAGQPFRKNLSTSNSAIQVLGVICAGGLAYYFETHGNGGSSYRSSSQPPVSYEGTETALWVMAVALAFCGIPLWKAWRGYIFATPETLTYYDGFTKVIFPWDDVVFVQMDRFSLWATSFSTVTRLQIATKDNCYEFRDNFDAFNALALMASTSIPNAAPTYFPADYPTKPTYED